MAEDYCTGEHVLRKSPNKRRIGKNSPDTQNIHGRDQKKTPRSEKTKVPVYLLPGVDAKKQWVPEGANVIYGKSSQEKDPTLFLRVGKFDTMNA